MKFLKRTSLVLLVAAFLSIAAHGFYTLGRQTEYNRMLWKVITQSDTIQAVPKEEQKDLYNEMKFHFALTTRGDN